VSVLASDCSKDLASETGIVRDKSVRNEVLMIDNKPPALAIHRYSANHTSRASRTEKARPPQYRSAALNTTCFTDLTSRTTPATDSLSKALSSTLLQDVDAQRSPAKSTPKDTRTATT
jgi:hypothetical protein